MRMYELMSGQQRPLVFTFEDLKFRFGVKDKYKLVGHFKARVLDIAKKNLMRAAPTRSTISRLRGAKLLDSNSFQHSILTTRTKHCMKQKCAQKFRQVRK